MPHPIITPLRRKAFLLTLCLGVFVVQLFLTGCATVAPLPPADLAAPGWQSRTGQAVWTPGRNLPEITGELLVATRADGETFVQFTKTPFSFVIARSTADSWQIELPTFGKFYSGRGTPSSRLIWLQFARWTQHQSVASPIRISETDAAHWRLENPANGEILEGVFTP